MTNNIQDLQKMITEKNAAINTLKNELDTVQEAIDQHEIELDRLLYLYYKALKCSCSRTMLLCNAAG